MDNTLVQIINEWIGTQALLRQTQQENESLKAQIGELQKPKVDNVDVPADSAVSQPVVDAQGVAKDSA